MYGTVARVSVKPGMMEQLRQYTHVYDNLKVPGQVATYVFQMDANPNEAYLVAIFDSKEAYDRNADDPAQDARFREMMQMLASEPEWHDGEVIYSLK